MGLPEKINRFALPAFFILLFCFVPSKDYGGDTYLRLINPGSSEKSPLHYGWSQTYHINYIREWAKSRGLRLIGDSAPLVDNMAAYVGAHGSAITVEGLKRWNEYRMWIDFVRFNNPEANGVPSLLRIVAGNRYVGYRIISTLRFDEVRGYFYIDIPVEITNWGVAEIRFEEQSPAPGHWGIWDIIVVNSRGLPEVIPESGNDPVMNIDAPIVQ